MAIYCVGSDKIDGKEKTYINRVIQALQSRGHTCENLGVSPNAVQRYGRSTASKGKIGVYVMGGRGLGTPTDLHMGIKQGYYHYDKVFFVGSYEFTHNQYLTTAMMDVPVTSCERGMSTVHCNLYKGMTPNQWNNKFTNVVYISRDTFDECIKVLVGGVSRNSNGNLVYGDAGENDNKVNVSFGFDKSKPFYAYFRIKYYIDDDRTKTHDILVDFSREAPTTSYRNHSYDIMSFNNKVGVFVNDKHSVNNFNLLEMLQIANDDLDGKHEYWIDNISFEYSFSRSSGTEVTATDETKSMMLYDPSTDNSSYKMLLYSIGFYNGETGNSTSFDSFGEPINDTLKNVLQDTTYITQMIYKPYRNQDIINFKNTNSNFSSQCTFVEDPYSDMKYQDENSDTVYIPITKISNVQYAPLNNLLTNYIVTFSEMYDIFEDDSEHYKSACSYLNLDKYMRFGERSETTDLQQTYGLYEAKYIARNKFIQESNEETTFTISCEGLPPCSIGDFVSTEMYNKEMTNVYNVASMEIKVDKDTRPIIQTELGLGDVDRKIKVSEALQEQRKQLKPHSTDTAYARYVGKDEKLWR